MITLLRVRPKQNLKDPTEDHLVPWHALTDMRWSTLPVTECVLLIQLIIYRLHRWLSFSEFSSAIWRSWAKFISGTNRCNITWHLLTEAPNSDNETLLYSPSHYMPQDTKWERQLPVSWPAYCTLPYHKVYSESNSVVVLPVKWYYTCCLKIMLAIFQKWWHEIAHAVSFFSENARFFLLLKKKRKKALWENLVLFQSQMSWSGRISCVTS